MKRVIAYTMHETEVRTAMERLKNPERTPGYVMGEADVQNVRRLRRDGLAVEIVGEAGEGRERVPVSWPRESGVVLPSRSLPPLRGALKAGKQDGGVRGAHNKSTGGPRAPVRSTEVADYEVSVAGPLVHLWRVALERVGGRIGERLVTSSRARPTYLLRLTRSAAKKIASMDFVTRVAAYEPPPIAASLKRTPTASPTRDGGKPTGGAPSRGIKKVEGMSRNIGLSAARAEDTTFDIGRYEVLLPNSELREAALAAIRKSGVRILEQGQRKLRVEAKASEPILARLRSEFRAQVSPYAKAQKHLDLASSLVGIGTAPKRSFPFQGKGQIIGVADTGIDVTHPDLKGRILKAVALGRAGRTDDPDGHGTHVTGIAVGTGRASGKQFQGAAPKARVYFQSLLDREGDLGGLPLELAKLFQPAYRAGVRIHNNSWGTLTRSRYTVSSYEVDEYVASHPDFLVVVSAGNAGSAADPVDGQPRNAKRGFVDWRSIDAPASCKNALVVGASRSSRTDYGYAARRHAEVWTEDFRHRPMSDETVSGDPEALAGFSSRGPCDDGRIKPDLLAPGTDIVAPKSKQADDENYWSCYPPNARYAVMGGTSMAAPLVAGCAALVREYFIAKRKHEPSAALLKATLVNGARWLTGRDAVADHAGVPNYHQGFGGLNMPSTVPTPSRPLLKLAFDDTWTDADWQFARAGDAARYTFEVVDGTEELRVCLTWTDSPGRSLQNLLGLLLEAPTATSGRWKKVFGNENRRKALKGVDMENNVQVVRVMNPVAGLYTLQVWAHEIVHPSQAYALVVSGSLASASLARSVLV